MNERLNDLLLKLESNLEVLRQRHEEAGTAHTEAKRALEESYERYTAADELVTALREYLKLMDDTPEALAALRSQIPF